MTSTHIRRNHLYTLRRIRGYRQKQLAVLLGYRGTSMISRFENGTTLPSLQVALLLQLTLGAQLAEIYVDLHHELEALILKRAAMLPPTLARSIRGRVLRED
jgi:DNA-binding XRE family transcriptional regulator